MYEDGIQLTSEQLSQREWHDRYFREHGAAIRQDDVTPQDKYYAVSTSAWLYLRSQLGDFDGKTVLDYCCGSGQFAVHLAARGATVTGVDISRVAVEVAQRLAADRGITPEQARFVVSPAESLPFSDDTFDVVAGLGALHHLDVRRACAEVARVLRPGGRAVFSDPLAYNPAMNVYRRLTSEVRTEGEHRLTKSDYHVMSEYFSTVCIRFFALTSLGAVPFRRSPGFGPLLRCLETVDRALFRLPGLKWLAWQAVVTVEGPIPRQTQPTSAVLR